jgi:hypothetical protein
MSYLGICKGSKMAKILSTTDMANVCASFILAVEEEPIYEKL